VFIYDDVEGSIRHTLQSPTPGSVDQLGYSVAVSGHVVVAGAPFDTVGGVFGVGSAHIYDARDGSHVAQLDNPTLASTDLFGSSVAVSGDFVAVGAHRDDAGASNAGVVHLFDPASGGYLRTIGHPSPFLGDLFGWSVSLSGSTLAVGADGAGGGGKVFLFDANTGNLLHTISNPNLHPDDNFGVSVSIAGDKLAVGNSNADVGQRNAGVAYVFDVSTGNLLNTLQNPLPTADDRFGHSVSLSGNTVVVGAYNDDSNDADVGSAYLFDATTGNLLDTLSNRTPDASDEFGYSVAISGELVLVGAPKDDTAGENQGIAHVFTLGPPPFVVGLSSDSVNENQPAGTTVGTLSAGVGATSPVNFTLAAGSGSDDNLDFAIVGNELRTAAVFDHESQPTLSIRVQATDATGLISTQIFSISATDVNEQPTSLHLSSNEIAEMNAVGAGVAQITTNDQDANESFTYSLVNGEGGEDNDKFAIVGAELQAVESFDFETRSRYSVRIRSQDSGGLTTEQAFRINIADVNPYPIDVLPTYDLRPVVDLNDARQSSNPEEALELDGVVYFAATTPGHGSELWRSDGTQAGTQMVLELSEGEESALPRSLTVFGTQLIFISNYSFLDPGAPPGSIPEQRVGLFSSDGTEAGTMLLRHFELPASSSTAESENVSFTEVNGNLLFVIPDGSGIDKELWKTDGTVAGTSLVKALPAGGGAPLPGFGGSAEIPSAVLGNLYLFNLDVDTFSGVHSLWRSDGTEAGTFLLREGEAGFGGLYDLDPSIVTVGSTAYFVSNSLSEGKELWSTDGTIAGTQLVHDIFAGFDDSGVRSMVAYDGALFFAADDGSSGLELWRSDGTSAGTQQVKDIAPDFMSGVESDIVSWGGHLYFAANDTFTGSELWKSDGTSAGTLLVLDSDSGPGGLLPTQFIDLGDKLLFTTYLNGLWRTDGTSGGTTSIANAAGVDFTIAGIRAFFRSDSAGSGWELWVTDGTSVGTEQIVDLNPGPANGADEILAVGLGGVVFRGTDTSVGTELGVSDGSPAGTRLIDVARGTPGANINDAIKVGDDFYLAAGNDLVKTDGTSSGTVILKTFSPAGGPEHLTNLNGLVYFAAEGSSARGVELWKTDGTVAGTVLAKDINPGSGDSNPDNFTVFDGAVFFTADDGTHGEELWKTDAGDAQARLREEFVAGSGDGEIDLLQPVGDLLYVIADEQLYGINRSVHYGEKLSLAETRGRSIMPWDEIVYFSGYTPEHGSELWRTDGTKAGTYLVRDLLAGPASSYPGGGVVLDGGEDAEGGGASIEAKLVFRAAVALNNFQLWATDGTTAETKQLTHLPPATDQDGNVASFAPIGLTRLGDKLVFEAFDAENGRELWESNGTEGGTRLLADLRPGPTPDPLLEANGTFTWFDQRIQSLVPFRDQVFFHTSDTASGLELWTSDGTSAGSRLAVDIVPGSDEGYPTSMFVAGDQLFLTADTLDYGFGNVSGRGELFFVNESPFVAPIERTIAAGQSMALELLEQDRDGDPLSYEVVSGPVNGAVTIEDGVLTYTPSGGFTGTESFTYRAFDGSLYSNTASISVSVQTNANQVMFALPDSSVTEQDGVLYVDVQLQQPAADILEIPYTIEGPDALPNGNDREHTLVIPMGASSERIPVYLKQGLDYETEAQILEITLRPNNEVALGTVSQHTLQIQDDDSQPTLKFFTPWQTVTESDETVGVRVGLSAASDEIIRTTVNVYSARAIRNQDFRAPLSIDLEFLPGQRVKTITVRLVDDDNVEPVKYLRLSFPSVENAIISSDESEFRHLVWIEDSDTSTVNLSPSVQFGVEGETITVEATRTGGNLELPLSVPFDVFEGGAEENADYTVSSDTFEFTVGASTAIVTVTLIDDGTDEVFEALTLLLEETGTFVAGDVASGYVGFYDNDTATVSLELGNTNLPGVSSPTSLRERNPYSLTEPITVELVARLSVPSADTISVPVVVNSADISGYAENGSDFQLDTSDIVFAPGQTEVRRTFEIFDDLETEPNELIRIALEPRQDQFFLRASGLRDDGSLWKTLEIRDDDEGVTISGPRTVKEDIGQVQFFATLAEPAERYISFPILDSGTANHLDYQFVEPALSPSGWRRVEFFPGDESKTITINVTNDELSEGPERLILELGRLLNGNFEFDNAITTTIADDDTPPTVSFRSDGLGLVGIDDMDSMTIAVDLSHAANQTVRLDVQISGSAVAEGKIEVVPSPLPGQTFVPHGQQSDLRVIAGTLLISPGHTEAEIVIRPDPALVGDHDVEIAINGGRNVFVPDVKPRTSRRILDAVSPNLPLPVPNSTIVAEAGAIHGILPDVLSNPDGIVVDLDTSKIATETLLSTAYNQDNWRYRIGRITEDRLASIQRLTAGIQLRTAERRSARLFLTRQLRPRILPPTS
jgi:ELWxxDGT repeat protein